jgi:hypothetical protein
MAFLNRRYSRILILNAANSDVAQRYPERTSDFNALQFIDVHGLAIRGVACPDHSNASNPKTLFKSLKRNLVVRIDPRAKSVRSSSFVEVNSTSCSLGIKLSLVRSPHQGIEQASTRSRTNHPVVRRNG